VENQIVYKKRTLSSHGKNWDSRFLWFTLIGNVVVGKLVYSGRFVKYDWRNVYLNS